MLEKIVNAKRKRLSGLDRERYQRHLETLLANPFPERSFRDAIRSNGSLSIIAEFKKRSPSAGIISLEADPEDQAKLYECAGVNAISVLTEEDHFGGDLDDLKRIKTAVGIPVLRKDFILEILQVTEAKAFGADAILLIAGLLSPALLAELIITAHSLKMDCLCEVHSREEVKIALDCGAAIIGINNRDLTTFKIDLGTTRRLRPLIPNNIIVVSESGIRTRADACYIRSSNVDAILVGTELMQSPDIALKVRELQS